MFFEILIRTPRSSTTINVTMSDKEYIIMKSFKTKIKLHQRSAMDYTLLSTEEEYF